MSFTNARTALPVCSPARASMLTGLYPHVHGLTENDGRFGGREGLEPGDWMIHQPLKAAGYRCGWFGKWHVDNHRSARDYGFEGYSLPGYGYPYGSAEYRDYLKRRRLAEPLARIEIPGEARLAAGTQVQLCAEQNWYEFESGSAILSGSEEAHESAFLTDLACNWLSGLGDKPFFLRIDTWGPHPPYLVSPVFARLFEERELSLPENFFHTLESRPQHHRDYWTYWRDTLQLDESAWRLMYRRALQHCVQVESSLCALLDHIDPDHTLVIFNSDHGDAVASNGAVANKGGLMSEATMSIPLMLAGPGIPGGETREHHVSSLDVPATIVDLCAIGQGDRFQRRSLLGPIASPRQFLSRGFMAEHYGLHENIIQRAWYQDDWKLVLQPDGFRELYHLADDPGEMRNLAPDEAFRQRLESMQTGLMDELERLGDEDFPLRFATLG